MKKQTKQNKTKNDQQVLKAQEQRKQYNTTNEVQMIYVSFFLLLHY